MLQEILVICDSRGSGLDRFLSLQKTGYKWQIQVLRGKGLKELLVAAHEMQARCDYQAILIMGGICDITKRDTRGRKVVMRGMVKEYLVQSKFEEIDYILKKVCENNRIVLLATTYGVDLQYYNWHLYGDDCCFIIPSEQNRLEETVDLYNKYIADNNATRGMATIRLGSKIHHPRPKGKMSSNYSLLWDGCHPDFQMLDMNAEKIVRVVDRYLQGH